MAILISHIYEDDYSSKIKDNKFFYAYTFFLGSCIILQIYTLHYFYNYSFSYDSMNEITFENIHINDTYPIHNKDLYLRNIKPRLHYIIPDYKTFVFEIIKKDIHSSLFINIFTIVSVVYLYNKYNFIFLKYILHDKFRLQRHHFIQYIALVSYLINVSYGLFINNIYQLRKIDANMNNIYLYANLVYQYYNLKYIFFLICISISTGTLITVLLYHYILKHIKGKQN